MRKENQHIEYKASFNDAVIETVSAFANTKGGRIYIGVSDDGQPIAPFTIGKETIPNWINEIKNKTQPSIIADLQAGTYSSYARNRKIADLFREAGVIEKYGSGIQRITNAFVNYGLQEPVFEEFQNGFGVTVLNNAHVNTTIFGSIAEEMA